MLTPDSLIMTLEGQRLVSDLAGTGPTFVLTWDGDRVTVGRVEIENTEIAQVPYRVELDDGNSFGCCKETLVLLRSGSPRYVETIEPETSLLPLYMKIDSHGYPAYREPGEWYKGALTASDRNRWRRLARLVAEWKLERRCEPGDTVFYLSSEKMDCRPDNLEIRRKVRKKTQKKVKFAEPLFEAQRFIDQNNHKASRIYLDTSCNLLSIRGLGTANLAVGGIFVSVDSE